MNAVLAPGLRERFQLDIRRLALLLAEIILDRLHLRQRKKQMPFAAELGKLLFGQVPQADVPQREPSSRAGFKLLGNIRLKMNRFDHAVGQQPRWQSVRNSASDSFPSMTYARPVRTCRAAMPMIADGHLRAGRDRVHHAGLEVNFDAAVLS